MKTGPRRCCCVPLARTACGGFGRRCAFAAQDQRRPGSLSLVFSEGDSKEPVKSTVQVLLRRARARPPRGHRSIPMAISSRRPAS